VSSFAASDQAQLFEAALEQVTLGALARFDGNEPLAENAQSPIALNVWCVALGDFAPAL
jgi:hypothetical protein